MQKGSWGGQGASIPHPSTGAVEMTGGRSGSGIRLVFIRVLIYSALAVMPVNLLIRERLSESPHAVVQPTDGPEPVLDELVASLGVVAFAGGEFP